MSDFSALTSELLTNPYAAKLAGEEAVAEATARMPKEKQADMLRQGMFLKANTPPAPAVPPFGPVGPPKLEFYQASELYGKTLERTEMIVQRMIPCGLTVLAGAPKRGKSWLSLALALAVASGADFLGQHTQRGSVLYLDLESRQYRVQDRLSQLIVGPAPAGLYIAHAAEPLGPRFYEQVEGWMKQAESPKLVIIDTLGRVKPSGKRAENAYESDTRQYGGLQSWAAQHRIGVVVVHHLRKTKDSDDWFDRINGSNGLVGVADAVLGLSGVRGEAISKLMVSGRDIDGDYNLAIRFENGRWVLESADSEQYEAELAYVDDPLIRGIYTFMYDRYEWQGSSTQLIDDIVEFTREPLDCGGANGVTRCMRTHSQMLFDRDGILWSYKRVGQRRVMFLRNTRLKPSQLNMEVLNEKV